MSQFTPTVKVEIQFAGETLTAELKRIRRTDQVQLMPAFSAMQKALQVARDKFPGLDDKKLAEKDPDLQVTTMQLVDAGAKVVGPYVVGLTPALKGADGTDLTVEQILDAQYFFPLTSTLVFELVKSGQMGEADPGN